MCRRLYGRESRILGEGPRQRDVALEDDLRYERFGASGIQSALSGAWLADVLSQLGRFDEAIGHAEAAVQIAEAADHPFTLCWGLFDLGSALGQRVGVSREQLEALPDFETSPLFSELERLVLRYAEQMTARVQVDGTLVEALRGHLSLEALVQLTLSIAAANFTNRFNEALGTELEVTASSGAPRT